MKLLIIALTLMFIGFPDCWAQNFTVVEAKRAYKKNGKKIKKGELLKSYEQIVVKEKGLLSLDVGSPIPLKIAVGTHHIDSLAINHLISIRRHDSLLNLLETKGLLTCKFKYQTWIVPGTNRHYEADRIKVINQNIVAHKTSTKPIIITWENPDKKYGGSYLLTIQDAFNKGFVAIVETQEPTIALKADFYGHRYLLYRIVAEDCRASRLFKLELK